MIVPDWVRTFEMYLQWLSKPRFWLGLACDRCASTRLRGHGRYERKAFLSHEGGTELSICRVLCVDCKRAPSIVPPFAASGAHAADGVIEDATARYTSTPDFSYRAAASAVGTAHSTVYRWVSRLGGVVLATVLGLLVRLRPDVDPLALIPKIVPAERRARTTTRAEVVRTALQVLVAGRRCSEEIARGAIVGRPSSLRLVLAVGGTT